MRPRGHEHVLEELVEVAQREVDESCGGLPRYPSPKVAVSFSMDFIAASSIPPQRGKISSAEKAKSPWQAPVVPVGIIASACSRSPLSM